MFASSFSNVRRFRKAFNLAPFQTPMGDDLEAHGMDVDIPSTPSTAKASVRTSDVANESMPGPSVGDREKLMAQRRGQGVGEPRTPERKRGALQPPSAPRKRRLPKGTLWDLPDFKVCSFTATHLTALMPCINAFFASVTPKPTVRKFDLVDAAAASPNVDDSEEPMAKRRRWGAGEPCTPKLKSLNVQTPPAPKKGFGIKVLRSSIDQLIPRFIRNSVTKHQRRLQVKAYGPRPQRQALPRDAPSVAYDKAKRPRVYHVQEREASKHTALEQQQFYEAMASLKANLDLTEIVRDDAMDNMELDHEVEIVDDECMVVDDEDVEMTDTGQTMNADDDVQPMEDQRQELSASLPYTEAAVAAEQPRAAIVDEELQIPQSVVAAKEQQTTFDAMDHVDDDIRQLSPGSSSPRVIFHGVSSDLTVADAQGYASAATTRLTRCPVREPSIPLPQLQVRILARHHYLAFQTHLLRRRYHIPGYMLKSHASPPSILLPCCLSSSLRFSPSSAPSSSNIPCSRPSTSAPEERIFFVISHEPYEVLQLTKHTFLAARIRLLRPGVHPASAGPRVLWRC
ncbi:uncharacterized protein BXZ73DRAFT_77380 [Epithele typhae]|uniref:uncharacterized protein n=1 Tax=Epithele typhae TaxID=378194 RepID=UPI0020078EE9|nr:uncharacterized protein BXZ73DRAFT_77380 [Epithele typhae]KAH9933227.1 hypothetical protein BXZ73DRAFT_77380 [Epithele typhae]